MPTMASVPPRWATAVAPIGPVAVATLLSRTPTRVHLTVVVKARFALRHDAPMVVAGRPSLVARDVHLEDDPTCSLVDASDLVPYRPTADVWLTGHAYPPGGRRAAVSVARLAIYRGDQQLLLKTVHILGDRAAADATPEPFDMMPLTYERAFGGLGCDDNPVGVGADERPLWPNLVHPDDPECVACFGPVSRYWRLRRQHVTTEQRRALEAKPPRIAEGFEWEYFQAAPADQRVPFLAGDEWVILDGMHPSVLRVQSRLPKVAGVARVLQRDGNARQQGQNIAMVADGLAIDADAQICALTWRGSVVVDPVKARDQWLIAGAIETPERPVDWSQAFEPRYLQGRSEPEPLPRDRSGVTLVSDVDAPLGVLDELAVDDPLSKTTVDPPRPDPGSVTDVRSLTDGGVSSYRRIGVHGQGPDVEGWPSYPLASDGEEVTETKTTDVTIPAPHHEGASGRFPAPIDTEPGEPPLQEEIMTAWEHEPAIEPSLPLGPPLGPPRPRRTTLAPAPLDRAKYAEALRRAGASDEDVDAWLSSLEGDEGGS